MLRPERSRHLFKRQKAERCHHRPLSTSKPQQPPEAVFRRQSTVHIRFLRGVLGQSRSPYRRRRRRAVLRGRVSLALLVAARADAHRSFMGAEIVGHFVPPWRNSGTLPKTPRFRTPHPAAMHLHRKIAILDMGTHRQQFKTVRQTRRCYGRDAFAGVVHRDERWGLTGGGFCLPPFARGLRGLNERAVRSPPTKGAV